MASDYGDDGDDPQPKRRIQDRLDRLQDIRDQFWSEGAGGSFSPATKRYIATVVMQVWDVLYQYRDESVLSEGDFPDISPVRDRLGRTPEVVVDSPRLGEKYTTRNVPAVNELDDWYLIELSEQLDDLANTLGFGASATDRPETSEFDEEDIVTLLATRNQADSLDDAPEDITDRVIDTLSEEETNGE